MAEARSPVQGTPPFDRGGWVLSPWAATVPVSLRLPLGRPASTNFQSEVLFDSTANRGPGLTNQQFQLFLEAILAVASL